MDPTIAFIRGINVGGRRRIAMADLREGLAAAGFEHVRTYVQSGNVVFATPSGGLDGVASKLERIIADTFSLEVRVLLRTRAALTAVAAGHPMAGDEADRAKLHVVFLEADPPPDALERLDPDRSPPDRFVVTGREVFLHYPDGAGRSKITADYFERVLGVAGTARNLNTIQKVLAMTGQIGGED